MPDPDNLEPDDDEHKFDPSKEENYDKISRHQKFGKFYRDAKNDKIWYSKDRAGHGGEHWKMFKQDGKKLYHQADIDINGKIMTKHKSEVGIKINMKDLIGTK